MPSYSLETISRLICLGPRRVHQLVKDGIIPEADKGRYDLIRTVQGYIQYLQSVSQGQGSKSLTEQRQRLAKLKADREEMELARDRGRLIDAELAMRLWGDVVVNIRARLLTVPTKLAPLTVGLKSVMEAKELLTKETHGICNELATPDLISKAIESRMGGNRRGAGNISSTANTQRKRMGGRKKVLKPGGKRRTG